ncbi:MAG: Fic family protein [Bacteroidetes bacterium]|nr:MAG: Fic family protein [Bacteroidota bacterium]
MSYCICKDNLIFLSKETNFVKKINKILQKKDRMLKKLPIEKDIETKKVLKKLASAHRALAELKGVVSTIPNENILINTLGLQEAKDSSAIENIITTHDDIYKANLNLEGFKSLNAKEVQNYISALKKGFALISKKKILTNNDIIEIQSELEKNKAGFRKLPGTALKNAITGETVYTPPQEYSEIIDLMSNLEQFINDDTISDFDPLVKMAIIHYQFESIHPFYDGNGRTGRIINVLYLVMKDLLNLPILYLSRYIILNKGDYYKLLQEIRETDNWENWLLFMLDAVEQISKETIELIGKIRELIFEYKNILRNNYKFYSQDLLNNLFKHPYTKIEFIERDLGVSRITAAKYLNELAKDGLLRKEKLGTGNYYINEKLMNLLTKK